MRYLIWSNEHRMWWRANGSGYTATIEEAGRYTYQQARDIVRKSTVDGRLFEQRTDPVTGQSYAWLSEHVVPAPDADHEVDGRITDWFGEGPELAARMAALAEHYRTVAVSAAGTAGARWRERVADDIESVLATEWDPRTPGPHPRCEQTLDGVRCLRRAHTPDVSHQFVADGAS
jgi:hypothetical protein